MSELPKNLNTLSTYSRDLIEFTNDIASAVKNSGYDVVELNDTKPWGSYIRIDGNQADEFVTDFFDDLTPEDARLGNPDAELSPKFLIVSPKQRLSLQTHERRAERWKFLTAGYYYKSITTDAGEINYAKAGEVVQFEKGETHRLCGNEEGFVVVAEIWQHTDPTHLSDEDDITRLEDDYSR